MGGILLTVPQHPFLWSVVDEYACHKRRYTKRELIKKVEDAGFQIVHTTSFVSFLLPVMLLSRMKRQKRRNNFEPVSELKINPYLNMIFENVLAIERTFIKYEFSFPAGGSLLMIAQRNRR